MGAYYQHDGITLYLGDCREVTEWLTADVLVTDPPYGIRRANWRSNAPCIAGELRSGAGASDRVLTDEHVAIRNTALNLWGTRPATRMRLIWDKGVAKIGGVGNWFTTDEEIYLVGDWENKRGMPRKPRGSVIRQNAEHENSGRRPNHPTPKPIGLMITLLDECPLGVIADPFAGSGSTLVAAKMQGREAIGVELEERYCETAARRLDQGVLEFPA